MEYFLMVLGHGFNLIYLIGFVVKKMMWLRIIMIIAATIEIIYFFLSSDPLWINRSWAFAFLFINLFHFYILAKDKLTLKLDKKEKSLYFTAFSKMTEVEFKKLLNLANWSTVPPDTVLIKQNEIIDSIIVIYKGMAKVESNGNIIAYLNEGNFAGEMSFITNERTNAKITTVTELEYLSISRTNITKLMNSSEEFKESINQIFNMDLIKKLKSD